MQVIKALNFNKNEEEPTFKENQSKSEVLPPQNHKLSAIQTIQPIELIPPNQLLLPLSIVNSYLSVAALKTRSDNPPDNDFDAQITALSEGRYGENALEAANKISLKFVTKVKDLIPLVEKERRKEEIAVALEDANYTEDDVLESLALPE